MKYKNSKIKYLLFSVILFSAQTVFAAEFSLVADMNEIKIEQDFVVDLYINTEKENINAVEGKIIIPNNFLTVSEIRSGNSVVNFWVEKPQVSGNEIIFSGITPGGYVLDEGLVLSLVFKAKKTGLTQINLADFFALKNDGNGTKAKIKTNDLKINIVSLGEFSEKDVTVFDKEKPETFKPEIGRDENMFENKWFVAFVTQDKGAGISGYEIRESKYKILNFSKWQPAESPFILNDQDLKSYVWIKAIDQKGNQRTVRLDPVNPVSWYANLDNWIIIILAIVVFYALRKKVWKKHSKNQQ